MRNRTPTYTNQQFREAVATSTSWIQVSEKLNLKPDLGGDGVKRFKQRAELLQLDYSHVKGREYRRPLEDVLVENSDYNNGYLKKRLINEKILEYKCAICGIDEWLDRPFPSQLHHINGVNTDNRLENLQLLCANCHCQTDTYARGRKFHGLAMDR